MIINQAVSEEMSIHKRMWSMNAFVLFFWFDHNCMTTDFIIIDQLASLDLCAGSLKVEEGVFEPFSMHEFRECVDVHQ